MHEIILVKEIRLIYWELGLRVKEVLNYMFGYQNRSCFLEVVSAQDYRFWLKIGQKVLKSTLSLFRVFRS